MTFPELAAHDMYTHRNGRVCILVEDGTWFVPYDVGGEGYTCEMEHGPSARDEREQPDLMTAGWDEAVRRIEVLERRARWKFEAGSRLWTYSDYGRNNKRLGDLALAMCSESGAMERAAAFMRTGEIPRVRREYRNYDLY